MGPTPMRMGLGMALMPLTLLIALLAANITAFGDSATSGPNQIALLITALVTGLVAAFKLGVSYDGLKEGIARAIGYTAIPIAILLMIGSLIGIWIASGVVPVLIDLGLELLAPRFFLPATCLVCAVVSLATGSSWSTSGTVGVALMGVGTTLGIDPAWVAGAVISGAYFGDKMCPLSDTTNLAPSMAGVELGAHVRHLMTTSVPAFVLALVAFSIMSAQAGAGTVAPAAIDEVQAALAGHFNLSPLILVIPAMTFLAIALRIPAVIALAMGIALGVVGLFAAQPELVARSLEGSGLGAHYRLAMDTLVGGYSGQTGHAMVDELIGRGGMSGMLNTVWLILCAMVFGGIMEAAGFLSRLAEAIAHGVKRTADVVAATLASCFALNLTASDQYLAIVVPGRMLPPLYERYGLAKQNLSRSLEDGGTVTSVLIPWNTCGAYHAAVLGVATLSYAPFCFFSILSPLVALFLAYTGRALPMVAEATAPAGEKKAPAVAAAAG